jgi:hypothetical protein
MSGFELENDEHFAAAVSRATIAVHGTVDDARKRDYTSARATASIALSLSPTCGPARSRR